MKIDKKGKYTEDTQETFNANRIPNKNYPFDHQAVILSKVVKMGGGRRMRSRRSRRRSGRRTQKRNRSLRKRSSLRKRRSLRRRRGRRSRRM